MSENIVIRKCGNGYDVKVYLNGALIKKAWGYDYAEERDEQQ